MIPAIHPACNFTLKPAPGDEDKVGTLPVMIHPAGVAAFFLPTTQELYALNRGEALCINFALDLRTTPFPPMSAGLWSDMFQDPDPCRPADPVAGLNPDIGLSLLLTGRRTAAAKYLRQIANAIDEGIAIPGITSPDLEVRLMSTDALSA